jgi:hypothetical protein
MHRSAVNRALFSELYWRCSGCVNTARSLRERQTFKCLAEALWRRTVQCPD